MATKNINKKTSPKIAKIASALLRNPQTPKKVKQVSGSDLAQAQKTKMLKIQP